MKDEINPYFSIVIPYFNRYELALETIASVLKQKFKEYEIIVINDGSTDGSGEKLETFFHSEKKVRVIHQPNLERGAARNRGFREARGAYVVFLDSDDLLLEDHLEVLYSRTKTIAVSSPDFIATKFEFLRNGNRFPSSTADLKEGYYDHRLFLEGNPLACNVTIKRDNPNLHLFREEKAFAIKEDWMFYIQNLVSQKLFLVNKVTLLLRDHAGRSIRQNHQDLIQKTFLSEKWILDNVQLSTPDRRLLVGQTNYFCAIHSYLDFRRKAAFNFLIKAFYNGGIRKKYFILLAKIIVGRKFMLKLNP